MYIGIDVGGTNIAVGILDEQLKIIKSGSVSTKAGRAYQDVVRDMAMLTFDLMQQAGLPRDIIKWVGIGTPGAVDVKEGIVRRANNLRWNNAPIASEFKRYIDKPVFMDNDANCAALGEFVMGAAGGKHSAVVITYGTGVGCGIIVDDKIYSGFGGSAGEIGHMVIDINGQVCNCGRSGCYETFASMTALVRRGSAAADANPLSAMAQIRDFSEHLNGKTIFELAKAGDETALTVVKQHIFYMAVGITNIVNILEPEAVVIGGAISKEGEYILEPIRRHVEEYAFCRTLQIPEIVTATLGNKAGIVGAAVLPDYQ